MIDSQASRRDQPQAPPRRPPRRRGGRRRRPLLEEPRLGPHVEAEQPALKVPSGATVREVAETFGVGSADVIKQLMQLGEMATLTQTLTDETIEVLAEALDRKVEVVSAADEVSDAPVFDDSDEELKDRPPVVTIMGHVDHGKTSLLDAIRETEVVAGEAGGITQHIGAYQVQQNGKTISFIDTPGHAAFTAMRARGADVTDIVVVVVAADDGVMPQTVEAIDHAKAAGVPMLVAINKIDLPAANADKVKGELANQGLTPEDWGGDTMFVDVSAKTKENLDELLESILLLAEVEELKANPDAPASGSVIESHLDPGRGPVVTVLIQRGTLEIGDSVVAGQQWGKVRAMQDHTGARLQQATPGDPVEVLGFDGVVEAGDRVEVVENDRRARQLAGERAHRLKTEQLARRGARRVTLDEVFAKAKEGEINELNVLLKADVSGSLEALQDEIAKLPQDEIGVNVIRSAAGGINESDVMLAAASDAVIIGFNVRPLADARKAADREGVEIRTYSVIYKITEELRAAMEGMLAPEEVEETLGQAEVLELFKASRVGTIAGCKVSDGRIARGAEVRLVRDGTVVWTGRIGSLRRFKDDVAEVDRGPGVRRRARRLPGRQGRRRARGLRDQADREDARVARRRRGHRANAGGGYLDRVAAYVCLIEIRVRLPHAGSLKEKRRFVKSLSVQLRQRFGAAVSEIAEQDTRRLAVLLCALVGGPDIGARADELERFVEARSPDGCGFERDLRTLTDIRG